MSDETLKFPNGRFKRPAGPLEPAERAKMIRTIANTPKNLAKAVAPITACQMEKCGPG